MHVTSAVEWIRGGHRFARGDGLQIFYRREGHGPTLLLLHAFPTWSYDYVELVPHVATDHDVVTLDFLGYGASDKPRDHVFTVVESADTVEGLLAKLGVSAVRLVAHDYGGIVAQELLDRRRRGRLSFTIEGVHLLNCGVIQAEYRPTRIQKLLANRLTGRLVASRITKSTMHRSLDAVRGPTHPLTHETFEELWYGIALHDGHQLAHQLVRYVHERALHGDRWLSALETYDGPLHLVWGLADPVAGVRVLDALRPRLPRARIDALEGVGHFPLSEVPTAVTEAIRAALT